MCAKCTPKLHIELQQELHRVRARGHLIISGLGVEEIAVAFTQGASPAVSGDEDSNSVCPSGIFFSGNLLESRCDDSHFLFEQGKGFAESFLLSFTPHGLQVLRGIDSTLRTENAY